MTQAILNPVKLPSSLLPAEEKFARCLANGVICTVGNGELPKEPIDFGDAANVIRAEVVRFFAYGGKGNDIVAGASISLEGAWIGGELDLSHANIPYVLEFSHCRFGFAVDMQWAECAALHMEGCRLSQDFLGRGLKMKGDLLFCNKFVAERAVLIGGARVGGNVFLDGGFSAKDGVRLLGARIGGDLVCMEGKFLNGLDARRAKIGGAFHWSKMTDGGGTVDLQDASAGILSDDLDSWKPFKVVLDGFTYDRFFDPAGVQSRIEWLGNRPDDMPFSPLPHEQAAKVLFGMGYARDARDILLEKERLQTKDERTPWHHKIGRRLWDVLAGYGHRLRYTAAWMAFFFLFGAAVFAFADYHGNIVPTHPVVTLSEGYKAKVAPAGGLRPTRAVPPEYPAFNPVVFSLDVFTPSAVFRQEDSWGPRSGGGDWLSPEVGVLWLLTGWYWPQVAAGWVLVPLFVLSVTGVLRPQRGPAGAESRRISAKRARCFFARVPA